MKSIKKIVAMSLVIFLLAPMQVDASEDVDQILRMRGVPEELINIMLEEQKQEIVENNLVYDSYTNEEMSFDSAGNVMARGTISDSTLSLTCSCYKESGYSTSKKRMTFYVNYDWSSVPQMTLTDAYGIAWSENWTAVPNSHKSYTYWKLEHNTRIEGETETALAYANQYGAGWNTDIKYAYGLQYVTDNYGYSRITLEAKNPSKSGTDQVRANYTHRKGVAGSFGLSFGICSVSYSGSADADSKGIYFNFSY